MKRISGSRRKEFEIDPVLSLRPNIQKLKRITKRIVSECACQRFEPSDDDVSDEGRQFIETELVKLETVLESLDEDIEAINGTRVSRL